MDTKFMKGLMPIKVGGFKVRPLYMSEINWYVEQFEKGVAGFKLASEHKQEMVLVITSECLHYTSGEDIKEEGCRCLIEDNSGNIVGGISFIELEQCVIEIGYFIFPEYRRNRIATGIVLGAIKSIRSTGRKYRFRLKIEVNNKASIGVATKCGLNLVGKTERGELIYETGG